MTYANSARDTAQVNDALHNQIHVQHGMTEEQFRAAASSPERRGSVVFSRLDSNWTGTFEELGSSRDGLQSAKPAKPFRVQAVPENVKHTFSGPSLINQERKSCEWDNYF